MKHRALKFFNKTSSERIWNIASYHSRHSMTWRWILSVSLEGPWLRRPRFWRYRTNPNCLQWGIVLPKCSVQWSSQEPMWYVDLYRRQRDEADQAAYRKWEAGRPYRDPDIQDFPTIGNA